MERHQKYFWKQFKLAVATPQVHIHIYLVFYKTLKAKTRSKRLGEGLERQTTMNSSWETNAGARPRNSCPFFEGCTQKEVQEPRQIQRKGTQQKLWWEEGMKTTQKAGCWTSLQGGTSGAPLSADNRVFLDIFSRKYWGSLVLFIFCLREKWKLNPPLFGTSTESSTYLILFILCC